MNGAAVPHDNFALFREKLGLTAAALACLEPYREAFLARSEEFGDRLTQFVSSMPDSRRALEFIDASDRHRRTWIAWYRGLFTQELSTLFQNLLWNSGVRHVSHNVDQRAVHLAYCTARLFLAELAEQEVPVDDRARVGATLSQMVDLCLMVETDSFLAATTQCDREVINGIAHQVRNPVAVIGGFVRNLQKKIDGSSAIQGLLAGMYDEARRLERMVTDVGTFVEIDQRPAAFGPCPLGEVLGSAIHRLSQEGWLPDRDVVQAPGADQFVLESDRAFLEHMFYHLLQNALEASAEAGDRVVRISTRVRGDPPRLLAVEILNSGRAPNPDELNHLFTPFYSSKPMGSGFGLPIAALVARKTHGSIELTVVPGGTRVTATLPLRAD